MSWRKGSIFFSSTRWFFYRELFFSSHTLPKTSTGTLIPVPSTYASRSCYLRFLIFKLPLIPHIPYTPRWSFPFLFLVKKILFKNMLCSIFSIPRLYFLCDLFFVLLEELEKCFFLFSFPFSLVCFFVFAG